MAKASKETKKPRPYALVGFEPTKTRNSFKDECDVNKIVQTYMATGMVTNVSRRPVEYGDAPDIDFFEAARIQAEIRSVAAQEALDADKEPEGDLDTPEPEKAPETAPEAPEATDDAEVA